MRKSMTDIHSSRDVLRDRRQGQFEIELADMSTIGQLREHLSDQLLLRSESDGSRLRPWAIGVVRLAQHAGNTSAR